MMKSIFLDVVISSLLSLSCGQALATEPNNLDTSSCEGVLDNGMTYFIKENHYQKDAASLRLVVKAGSIHESDQELGYAHFLEHMVFRGSKNFPDGELIKTLERKGAAFGPDTNAYTDFEHTAYLLEIPIQDVASFKESLQILCDIATFAQVPQEALDKERGVVLDELRLRFESPNGRVSIQAMEFLLDGSFYAKRFPIGTKESIEACSSESLRNFYLKHYTPDRMAIVAVGDFSKDEVLASIKEVFSQVEVKKTHATNLKMEILERENRFLMCSDKELTDSWFTAVLMKPDEDIEDDFISFKKSTIKSLIADMITRRFSILVNAESRPFKSGYTSVIPFYGNTSFYFQISCWEQDIEKGIKEFLKVLKSIETVGFGVKEYEMALNLLKTRAASLMDSKDSTLNATYAQAYVDFFINKNEVYSVEEEVALYEKLLAELTLEDIQQELKEHFDHVDRSFFLSTGSQVSFSEAEMKNMIEESLALDSIEIFNQTADEQVDQVIENGLVVSKTKKASGIDHWKLSNGMDVYLHKVAIQSNTISIQALAKDGLASFEEKDFISAACSFNYFHSCGLMGMNPSALRDWLNGKETSIHWYATLGSRGLKGYAKKKDLETFFKMFRSIFEAPYFTDEGWKQYLAQTQDFLDTKMNNPLIRAGDKFNELISKNDYLIRSMQSLDQVDQKVAEASFKELFNNPAEFALVIVGDFDETEVEKYLEHYVASIPEKGSLKAPIKDKIQIITETKELDFPEGDGNQAIVFLGLPSKVATKEISSERNDYFDATAFILQNRLTKEIRSQDGESYGIGVYFYKPFQLHADQAILVVHLSLEPTRANLVKNKILTLIKDYIETGVTEEELATYKAIYKQKIVKSRVSLDSMVENINQSILAKESITFDKDENSPHLTKENLDLFIQQSLQSEVYGALSLLPKTEALKDNKS